MTFVTSEERVEAVPLGFVEWPVLASRYERAVEMLTDLEMATPDEICGDVDLLEIVHDLRLIGERAQWRGRSPRVLVVEPAPVSSRRRRFERVVARVRRRLAGAW